MNGSGRAGALATPALVGRAGARRGARERPALGFGPRCGCGLGRRAGSLRHPVLLPTSWRPAIGYARDGFPVSTRLANDIAAQSGALNDHARALYLPGGEPPPVGTLLSNPALAATLERIAREGSDGFYRGFVAQRLTTFLEDSGGYLRAPDLAAHTTTWVEPLRGDYADFTMLVLPPHHPGDRAVAALRDGEGVRSGSDGRGQRRISCTP